jgi:hypothetical protein
VESRVCANVGAGTAATSQHDDAKAIVHLIKTNLMVGIGAFPLGE